MQTLRTTFNDIPLTVHYAECNGEPYMEHVFLGDVDVFEILADYVLDSLEAELHALVVAEAANAEDARVESQYEAMMERQVEQWR